MRYLFSLVVLSACGVFRQPSDIVKPGPVYCQPINSGMEKCWDGKDLPWLCTVGDDGGWTCVPILVDR